MITTFILGGVMALIVIGGNIYYDRRDKSPINWKRAFAWAGAAFALTLLIGWITE